MNQEEISSIAEDLLDQFKPEYLLYKPNSEYLLKSLKSLSNVYIFSRNAKNSNKDELSEFK